MVPSGRLKAAGIAVTKLEKAITRKSARQKELEQLEASIEQAIKRHLSIGIP